MKIAAVFLVLGLFISTMAFAQIKPCEELKSEIEKKLDDKGVVNYTLEIVPAEEIKDQKVVGSCEGGTKKITYTREAAAAAESKSPEKE